MVTKLFKALSKESPNGYSKEASELPEAIRELLKKQNNTVDVDEPVGRKQPVNNENTSPVPEREKSVLDDRIAKNALETIEIETQSFSPEKKESEFGRKHTKQKPIIIQIEPRKDSLPEKLDWELVGKNPKQKSLISKKENQKFLGIGQKSKSEKNVQNEETLTPFNIESDNRLLLEAPSIPPQKTIPTYIPINRIEELPDSLPIHFGAKEFSTLIRPQQKIAFDAICQTLPHCKNDFVAKADHWSVDLPILQHGQYSLMRCTFPIRNASGGNVIGFTLSGVYGGQPLFPRLLVEGTAEIIPNEVREMIYRRFLALSARSACPLHQRPRLMLRVSYTRPDYSYSRIAEHMTKEHNNTLAGEEIRIGEEAIKSNFKKFKSVAEELFGVEFKSRKVIANYWVEMGFGLKPVPELQK